MLAWNESDSIQSQNKRLGAAVIATAADSASATTTLVVDHASTADAAGSSVSHPVKPTIDDNTAEARVGNLGSDSTSQRCRSDARCHSAIASVVARIAAAVMAIPANTIALALALDALA